MKLFIANMSILSIDFDVVGLFSCNCLVAGFGLTNLCLLVLPAFLVSVVVPWVVVLHHPLKVVVGRLAVAGFGGGVPLGLSLHPDDLLLAVVVVGVERMADGHGQWEECDKSLKCKTVKNSIHSTLLLKCYNTQQNNNYTNSTVGAALCDLDTLITLTKWYHQSTHTLVDWLY